MAEPLFQLARVRRIEREWAALRILAVSNPGRMHVSEPWVELNDTPAYRQENTASPGIRVRFEFPEYYPSVPVEAFLEHPVVHPNVHPETGFVCLWDGRHAGTALVEAVLQLQRIVTWHLKNRSADHLMQPEAGDLSPLTYTPLAVPADYYLERSAGAMAGTRRKRLS